MKLKSIDEDTGTPYRLQQMAYDEGFAAGVKGSNKHHLIQTIRKEVEGKMEDWADKEHERWSKWQEYLHSQCFRSSEFTGALIIPADLVARWERQIITPYTELSEKEKESDREQVRPYIKDILTLLTTLEKEVLE